MEAVLVLCLTHSTTHAQTIILSKTGAARLNTVLGRAHHAHTLYLQNFVYKAKLKNVQDVYNRIPYGIIEILNNK